MTNHDDTGSDAGTASFPNHWTAFMTGTTVGTLAGGFTELTDAVEKLSPQREGAVQGAAELMPYVASLITKLT